MPIIGGNIHLWHRKRYVPSQQWPHLASFRHLFLIKHKQHDGSFLLTKPHLGEARISMMVTGKDIGAFVKILIESFFGVNLFGYNSLIGWSEYIRI